MIQRLPDQPTEYRPLDEVRPEVERMMRAEAGDVMFEVRHPDAGTSAVRAVWEKHMAPAIAANPGHTAYFYCLDEGDADSLCAFQQSSSAEEARAFLETPSYLAHLEEVEPLLSGPPQVTRLTPVWSKGA